jgi:hypothetical protein
MMRKRRPFIRESAVRDARLVVIATEDSKAAVTYFRRMASPAYYQSSHVHVEVLQRESTASAPEHVLRQLDDWREEYQIGEGDELWLVIDVDRWGDAKLSDIARQCKQKDIDLAISNPAIELWFLLHLTSLERYDDAARKELEENAHVSKHRTRLEHAILQISGRYSKGNFDADRYLPHVEEAIARAKRLDVRTDDRWPQTLGTRVYRLADSIISSAQYKPQ